MASSLVYCPKCKKEVETVWKFSRERCVVCKEPLDKDPINMNVYISLGTEELNRRQVINMEKLGIL